MIDQDTYRHLKAEIEVRTAADRQLLDKLRADVRPLRNITKRIHPRSATSVSLVATDGGNRLPGFGLSKRIMAWLQRRDRVSR